MRSLWSFLLNLTLSQFFATNYVSCLVVPQTETLSNQSSFSRKIQEKRRDIVKKTLNMPQGRGVNLAAPKLLRAWPLNRDPKGVAPDFPLTSARVFVTIMSTIMTWYAQRQYTNVMASAGITLAISACLDKRLGQAAFTGTFAGMGSTILIPNWKYAFGLGTLTSFLFEIFIHQKQLFLGIGGRLGATAFLASNLVATMQSIRTGFFIPPISNLVNSLSKNSSLIMSMAFWHAFGSVSTIFLRETGDDSTSADPVRASAVVGLLAGLLMEDKSAALALYAGSFAGMSLPSRLMNQSKTVFPITSTQSVTKLSLLLSFAISGAIGGMIHGALITFEWWPGGWGGKAGLCSFLGCLIFRGLAVLNGKLKLAYKPVP